MPPDVFRQLFDRLIAALGLGAERHRGNRVEIAGETPPQTVDGGTFAAADGVGPRVCGVLTGEPRESLRWLRRLARRQHPNDVVGGAARKPATAVVATTLTKVATGQATPVREGQCELAEQLFPNHNPGPGTLKGIPVPEPTNLSTYVRNRDVAIALGKAFFWDMQVGSDGVQACGSCHFRAGADPRSINQLNPGGADNAEGTINLGGPNYQLKTTDYPLHKLADPTDRHSNVIRDSDDVTSSQGVHFRQFVGVEPGATRDIATPIPDPVFNIDAVNTRRAEPRNTPTMINAAFNHNNFWDRRARNIFNGFSVQGAGDSAARVLRATGLGRIDRVIVRIDNASLASQAVGPPLSDREMGSVGRTFKDIGRRLAPAVPLAPAGSVAQRRRARALRECRRPSWLDHDISRAD